MKPILLSLLLIAMWSCEGKKETITEGRQAVKEVVNQPFEALKSTKESLQDSAEKQKAALEEAENSNK
jgi:hypothetical protein